MRASETENTLLEAFFGQCCRSLVLAPCPLLLLLTPQSPLLLPRRFELTFVAASDEGLFDADITQARRLKEAEAVRRFKAEASELTTLAEVHQWMHQTHRCYAVARQHEPTSDPTADAKLLATY